MANQQKTAAILGLGIVGSRVRENLVEAGYTVPCWSRSQHGFPDETDTPAAAVAEAGTVSIYLKDAPMVREVFEKARPGLKKGATVLNHATVDLETTLWLASECEKAGCEFIDAPFTGSKDAAGSGQLFYYLGGRSSLIDRHLSYLAHSSKGHLLCGKIGAATVVKLGTNLISACTVQAMSEALAIAVRHGVDPEVFTEAACKNGSGSALMAMKFPGILAGNYEPHFTLANMLKDSRYALALAESGGIEVPAIGVVSQRMNELCEAGHAGEDFSALARAYAK